MKKIRQIFVFFFLCFFSGLLLGCGGEGVENAPCFTPNLECESSDRGSGYCRYGNSCIYMSVNECYNYYGGTNYGNDANCGVYVYPSSSSYRSSVPSSSSIPALQYAFCVYPESQTCFQGSFTSCPSGGLLYNICPFNISSSSYGISSSSSSSSSIPPSSSSSVPPSSSSLAYSGRGNNINNYSTVVIGTQTWMAENLDYAVEGSKCYNNDPARCNTYGSLYNWATAMDLPSSCNSSYCSSQINSPHRGICPSGWHIPSYDEWNTLSSYVQSNSGCSSCDAKLLKATSGWYSNGNGTDTYGFSALPGGSGDSDGSFYYVGDVGSWWSASEGEGSSYDA